VLTGDRELASLLLDLAEKPGVLNRQRRLGGERLQELDDFRRELSRANVISCVTTTMVMASAISSRTTIRTSPIISGASVEVISSRNRILGSNATARAMPTRRS
jgi:hypothetical protein